MVLEDCVRELAQRRDVGQHQRQRCRKHENDGKNPPGTGCLQRAFQIRLFSHDYPITD